MRLFIIFTIFLLCALTVFARPQEYEEVEGKPKEIEEKQDGWWSNFKKKVKTAVLKWRDDLKSLWDEVLAKATDMRSWSEEMFASFKQRFKNWLESNPEIREDEKNEIETFVSKLKLPKDKSKEEEINP